MTSKPMDHGIVLDFDRAAQGTFLGRDEPVLDFD